ncbi:acyltransferase family protein [Polynucleobacter paneuropaeus]|nr:acyltransferase family protein [Polynucleobacter paneuropaeus]QWD52927.1 acyltransferase family protein [Polynucleobacter paneuropaeus]QWD57839.1 acyltransferase family protein [Polynucleobacter paneuropaeus]
MSPNIKNRDQFLDIAKGLAIILVILGHTFQGLSENFDDLIGFRVIYSFHMPLFIFISGMVFSVTLKKTALEQTQIHSLFTLYLTRIYRSFIRLIIPFSAWTIIGYFLNKRYEEGKIWEFEPLLTFFVKVIRSPDWSLWFLVCVFYCICALSLIEFCCAILRLKFNIKKKYVFEITLILLSIYISSILHGIGIRTGGYGVGFLMSYFIYFTLGYIVAGPIIKSILKKSITYFSILIFICLVPFWHRTSPHHLSLTTPEFIVPYLNNNLFGGFLALLGSLTVMLLVEFFSNRPNWILSKFLARCGVLSLGIYAIHFYFLVYKPPVLGPLIISVLITLIIQKIPILRVVLLGEPSRSKVAVSDTHPIRG